MSSKTWIGAQALVDPKRIDRHGTWYVAEYRIRNMSKWWPAILAFGLGTPLLYLASVGIGIGALVDQNLGSNGINGVGYLVFLAPALLVTAGIQGTMDEVTFPTLHGFMWAKTFFGMNSTGLTARHISNGVLLSALLRTVITVIFYWVILWWADAFISPTAWLAMPIALVAGACFGAFMMAITALIKNDDGFLALIGRFIIAPMFLFSGTFYPLSTLPGYLQWIGWVSPLWHATELCRWVTFDYPVNTALLITHATYLLVLGVVGLVWSQRIFTKKLAA